jgi:hypothetical protein
MKVETKLIKTGLGLLNLAEKLGNVSQACKVMGYSRDSFYRLKSCTIQAEKLRFMKSPEQAHFKEPR